MVTTEHARHFYNPEEVPVKIYSDKDEWEVGCPILYDSFLDFISIMNAQSS